MNDRQLLSFIVAAEKGSFYQAAQILYLTPQTLVQQVNALEKEIGVALLERTNKGVRMTAAGEVFYRGAKGSLSQREDLVKRTRDAASRKREQLRIALSSTPMLLPKIVTEYHAQYPDTELKFTRMDSAGWMNLLCDAEVDIIEGSFSRELDSFDIAFTGLLRESRSCIMSSTHPLAGKAEIHPADFSGQTIYVNNIVWVGALKEEIETAADHVTVEEHPCDLITVFQCCMDGKLYFAPTRHTKLFAPLVVRPIATDLKWEFGLAYRKKHSSAVDCFLEVARSLNLDEP